MRFVLRTSVLYGGAILVLAFLSLAVLSGEAYAVTYEVSIEENRSFNPSTVTINIGDTVRWTSNNSTPAAQEDQVASDNHPSHLLYPDPVCPDASCLDSIGLIDFGETYSFTFQCSGTWGYHNHLSVGKNGTVTVTDVSSVPPAVTGLSASATAEDSIYLTWASPGDDQGTFVGCATPGPYDIRYSTDGAITEAEWAAATPVTGEPVPQVAGASESMTVTGLDPETEYYFALKTDDDDLPLTSSISNSPNATTLAEGAAPRPTPTSGPIPDTQAPNPPKNVEVSVGDSFATFTWVNTLDADFSHMRLYRSEEEDKLGEIVADNVIGTTHTDRDLTNGVTYYYTLMSVDTPAGNESTNKDQVRAIPVAAVPFQETSAGVTRKEGGGVSLSDGERTLLNLTIPPFAVDENVDVFAKTLPQGDVLPNIPLPDELAFLGTSIYDIEAFLSFSGEASLIITPFPMELIVYYTDDDVFSIDESTLRLAKYDEANVTWYVLEDAVQDASANRMTYLASNLSRFALVSPNDFEPPGLPMNVEGDTSARDVNTLTWEQPEDTDFHHVRVYRSVQEGQLGELAATTVTGIRYNDGAAQAGVDYYYTLFSVDRAGNISIEGTSVLVEAPPAAPTHPSILSGEIVQVLGSAKVWLVQKLDIFTFLRHVLDPQVPMFYAHLASTFWERIQFVAVFDTAVESHLVRCSSCPEGENEKVWEINDDGTRHWLNMTSEQFVERLGGDAVYAETAIFEINEAELSYYVLGPDVLP